MWDITEFQEILKSSRKAEPNEENEEDTKGKQAKIPTIKYTLVSSIEASHRGAITHLTWLPPHYEVFVN
jgi:hypothetical protein